MESLSKQFILCFTFFHMIIILKISKEKLDMLTWTKSPNKACHYQIIPSEYFPPSASYATKSLLVQILMTRYQNYE